MTKSIYPSGKSIKSLPSKGRKTIMGSPKSPAEFKMPMKNFGSGGKGIGKSL